MKVSLFSRIFAESIVDDFGVPLNIAGGEIAQFKFRRSIECKINIQEQSSGYQSKRASSLFCNNRTNNDLLLLQSSIRRALASEIVPQYEVFNIIALRRRNLPIPPSGTLTYIKDGKEEKLKQALLKAGDTYIILLNILGYFPNEPEIFFVAKESQHGKYIFQKNNLEIQGDIHIENIEDSSEYGLQRLTAQIVIHPHDFQEIANQRTIIYTTEVHPLPGEIYTIESDKLTIEPDIYESRNY